MGLSGYRGRLISCMRVGIRRLNTAATSYGPDLRHPRLTRPFGADGPRVESRAELPEVILDCQVEPLRTAAQQQGPGGNVPDFSLAFVLHFEDLEARGLVGDNGVSLIQPNDRVVAQYDGDGNLVRVHENLYIEHTQEAGQGLGNGRNLLVCFCIDRAQGVPTTP